ncbi:hypothetical protein SCHPADRAFT_996856 [Schizopora paradoxa]|uniref:MYND-type domain-containing protein n=1 Tax=Schizopora paradoxa TaxID=27342 RepID=A0A0H2RQA1_9AGAM|nr:hypothetical protein SCHPADRAFT_996856 [Schizopora paradoxa]
MTTVSKEAQDWLKNPRKAINLAKGGSRKHVLAIPTTIRNIYAHLRHNALEVLLLHVSKEDQSFELAEALLSCIGWLMPDLQPSHQPTHTQNLERLIIQHSKVVCKMLRLYSEKSNFFSKDGIEVAGASLDPTALKLQLRDTGACLKVLCMNQAMSPVIFGDAEMLRIPVRFWLSSVLASKPGEVDPAVHEILFACAGPPIQEDDSRFFHMLVEENGGDAYGIETLLVSEMKAMTKTKLRDAKLDISYREGFSALINLNMTLYMLVLEGSIHNTYSISNKLLILTHAVGKRIQLDEPNDEPWQSGVFFYISIIGHLLELRDGVRWAVIAIQSGFLSIITAILNLSRSGGRPLHEKDARNLRATIRSLTLYLVHYSVVRAAVNAIEPVEREDLGALNEVPFFYEWIEFHSTLLERAVFMSQLGQKIISSERRLHCDFCLEIRPLQELKKCEKCRRTFYCSKKCQTLDWRQSDHKVTCANFEADNDSTMFLSTTDRFFMSHLACYDIRRYSRALAEIIQVRYSGIPVNELCFRIYYQKSREQTVISLARISEESPGLLSRVARQAKDQPLPRLVEVFYAGGITRCTRSFYSIIPEVYFSVPKVKDRLKELVMTPVIRSRFRSNFRYWPEWCRLYDRDLDEDLDAVEITEDRDEVGAILSHMRLGTMGSGDYLPPVLFPLTYKYSWKDIDKVALDCRRDWELDDEGTLF